ncbi:dTDP-4-dehydrorhamnose reductase [Methanoregula boonei 6A8]|jgi:dTDP-4-dehydrorhamnose reductase|uniref:dTDP-4-dehydrorhamnose reductase n=1 Tax=Methanoregula boonei (strain DSM 21154 / JCM 14090 / 6A8) TaxID=456442 RepID=A7I956_METB6|nr:dTDP-4-dehydrorhamnose reductase [Methanoregula boonei]ABS56267.1 dTDP-4-dehydrorhamnose reductase [Methanoregula boonei 6A8]
MRVLITGVNGQLGQDIRKVCEQNSIDHIATGSKELNISNVSEVQHFVKKNPVDVIINCAAYNAVDLAETEWKKAYRVNGLGVRNLATAANSLGAVFVHFSTDYVFDGKSRLPYTIADLPRPISRYGMSKLLGETMTRDIADTFILIRTSWVFGKGNDNFPKKIMGWSKNKTELKVVDDQVASPTYTADLAKATLDLILKNARGMYHITNSGYCSRYEWAEFLLAKVGWKGNLVRGSSDEFMSAAQRPAYSVLDNFGTPECLGYSLPDWKDATERFLQDLEAVS